MIYKEKEGITIIIEKTIADNKSISYSNTWKLISLTVNSDLSAVGFLAKITNKLAEKGISVNVVSAYNHDYLFVPAEMSDKAMKSLNELSKI